MNPMSFPPPPTKIRTILKGIPVLETQEDLDKASFMSQILYIFDCLSLNNALKVRMRHVFEDKKRNFLERYI